MKLLITMMAAALVCAPAGAADVSQQAEVSVQQVHLKTVNGNNAHKFAEYETRPNGVIFERYGLDVDGDNYVLSCEARKVSLEDQSYKCAGGQPGKFGYKFGWDQTPHVFSNQARTPYTEIGPGVLDLPDQMQLDIQNNLSIYQSSKAANSGSFRQWLSNRPLQTSKTRDDKATLDLRYRPLDPLTLNVGVMRLTKKGTRPLGASFGFGQPIELLEPIDYVTHEVTVGAEFVKPQYQLGGSYMMSSFENKKDTLTWDSFKRLDDRYTNSSGYSTSDQGGKGRMARAPSNIAHTFSLNGAVELPLETRFSGEASYAMWLARNEMLPYTINSAMNQNAGNLAFNPDANANLQGAGNAIYVPPFDASDPANRPGTDVDSRIDVYMMDWKLVNRAIHDLKLMLEWRTLAEVNKSQQFYLPGHAVFDQRWTDAEAFDTKRESFQRDRLTFKADYEVSHPVSVAFDYSVERERVTREVSDRYEHSGTVSSVIRPSHNQLLNVSYTLALRRGRDFNRETYVNDAGTTYIETPGLRRFDAADRNRNKGRVQYQYAGDTGLLASFSAYGYYDKYRPGKGDLTGGSATRTNSVYGLLDERSLALATDFTVPVGEAWELGAYYEWEMRRAMMKSNRANSANMTQLAINEWMVRLKELSNVGGLSANWKKDAWDAGVGYELLASVFKEDLVLQGGGANVNTFQGLPSTLRMRHSFKLNGGYKLTKNLKVTGRYAFEKYDVRDFQNEDIPVQAIENSIYVGASLRPYRAHIASLGLDYRF